MGIWRPGLCRVAVTIELVAASCGAHHTVRAASCPTLPLTALGGCTQPPALLLLRAARRGGDQRMTLLSCVCWVRVAALQVRVRPSLHPHRESLVTNVAPFPSPHCPWFLLCAAPCAPWRGVAPIPKHWRGCIPQIRSACVHPQPPVLPQFLLPEAVLGCCVVEGRAVPGDSQASLMVSPPPKPGAALHCSMVQ